MILLQPEQTRVVFPTITVGRCPCCVELGEAVLKSNALMWEAAHDAGCWYTWHALPPTASPYYRYEPGSDYFRALQKEIKELEKQ